MKLLALHGFCVGGGFDVAEGQIYLAPSSRSGLADVWAGRAQIVASSTSTTSTGATIVSTATFTTKVLSSYPSVSKTESENLTEPVIS